MFSEVTDQLRMAILSVTPGNPFTLGFFNAKFQYGDCQNVRYSRKSVTSENLCTLENINQLLFGYLSYSIFKRMKLLL